MSDDTTPQDDAAMSPASTGSLAWISVKEQLPPGGVRVLIWCGPGTFVDFATLDWKYGWHYDDYGSPEPTHWMPVLEPPNMGSGGPNMGSKLGSK